MLELLTVPAYLAVRAGLVARAGMRGVALYGAAVERGGDARRTWRRTRPYAAMPSAEHLLVAFSRDTLPSRDALFR